MKDVLGSVALVAGEKQHIIPLDGFNPAFAVKIEKCLLLGLKTGGDNRERLVSGQLFLLARHGHPGNATLFGLNLTQYLYCFGEVGPKAACGGSPNAERR